MQDIGVASPLFAIQSCERFSEIMPKPSIVGNPGERLNLTARYRLACLGVECRTDMGKLQAIDLTAAGAC